MAMARFGDGFCLSSCVGGRKGGPICFFCTGAIFFCIKLGGAAFIGAAFLRFMAGTLELS